MVGGGETGYIGAALDKSAAARRTVDDLIVRRHGTDTLSGLNQGHVSAAWRDGRRASFISVHGMRNERRAIVLAQAMRAQSTRLPLRR